MHAFFVLLATFWSGARAASIDDRRFVDALEVSKRSFSLVPCWGSSSADDKASWLNCCHPSHGPAGNATCWQRWHRLSSGERSVRQTYSRCCAFNDVSTFDGWIREYAANLSNNTCDGRHAPVCQFASTRTALARRTRSQAKQLLQRSFNQGSHMVPRVEFHHLTPHSGTELRTKGPPIPVLGWAVVFDSEFLSGRMLKSIDWPVLQLVVIAMGEAPYLEEFLRKAIEIRPDLRVIRHRKNLGCAGGWNEILHLTSSQPWWLISSYDVAFPPGALRNIAVTQEALNAQESRTNAGPGVRTFAIIGQPISVNSLPAFVITRRAVAQAGLFDENYWPIYAEEYDYANRLRHVGLAYQRDVSISIIHGPEDWEAGKHYSGTFETLSPAKWTYEDRGQMNNFSRMLESAGNFKTQYCYKFTTVEDRPFMCGIPQFLVGGVGPYGIRQESPDWGDWVLDPSRRACILDKRPFCPYDVRLIRFKNKTKQS